MFTASQNPPTYSAHFFILLPHPIPTQFHRTEHPNHAYVHTHATRTHTHTHMLLHLLWELYEKSTISMQHENNDRWKGSCSSTVCKERGRRREEREVHYKVENLTKYECSSLWLVNRLHNLEKSLQGHIVHRRSTDFFRAKFSSTL